MSTICDAPPYILYHFEYSCGRVKYNHSVVARPKDWTCFCVSLGCKLHRHICTMKLLLFTINAASVWKTKAVFRNWNSLQYVIVCVFCWTIDICNACCGMSYAFCQKSAPYFNIFHQRAPPCPQLFEVVLLIQAMILWCCYGSGLRYLRRCCCCCR